MENSGGPLTRAGSLSSQVVALYQEGRYTDAVPLACEALAIREAALESDHPSLAQSLNDLAVLLGAQGDYAAARPLHERALAIREAALGPDHPSVAQSLNNFALLLRDQRDYAAARLLFERSLAINDSALGPDHPDVATSLDNLGGLLQTQGDYAAARPLHERALAIREAALGPDHPDVATSLNNLALLLKAQGDYGEARPLFERARAIWEVVLGPDHLRVATSLNNLAFLLVDQGDYAEARPLYERALVIREAALGPDHPDVATSLNNLGALLKKQGDYVVARPLYERALAIWEEALGPDHPLVATGLNNLTGLLHAQSDYHAARPLLERAACIYDGLTERVLSTLSAAEQRAFIDLDLGEQTGLLFSSQREGEWLAAAYALIGGWKGLLLREMRRQTAFGALAADPAYAEDVGKLQKIRTQIAQAFRSGDPALSTFTEEKERLERRLAAALAADAAQDPWRRLGLDGLRAALPADTAFVDIYRYAYSEAGQFVESRYIAVVTSCAAGPVLVNLGNANEIESRLAVWRTAVIERLLETDPTRALFATLWAPIAEALPPITRRLWISPDGQLARLPWNFLAALDVKAEALSVAHVPSARALLRLLTSEPDANEPAEADVFVVGGVDFGGSKGPFRPLPGTGEEAEAIAAIALGAGLSSVVMTGEEPTREAVLAALPSARYAHLATHGFFSGESEEAYEARSRTLSLVGAFRCEDDRDELLATLMVRNPLVESGIALAGANAGGVLTAEEFVGLDLSGTELVVLSACDTGRGTEVTGQGVMGLRASVFAAGARALLLSLWKVDDAATALLMEQFYRGLWAEDLAPAEALERAQTAVREYEDAEGRRPFASTVYWAAWVLDGEAWHTP